MDIKKAREDLRKGKTIYDMPLKVVYYARVSTDKDDQLNSLENQQNYFEEMIAENKNWKFVRGYIDEGISGTAVKNRTQFLNMIEAASLGKIDLILTKEISRFSRNTVDSIKYTEYLLKQGTIVYFLSDNLNTIQEDAEFRLTIMSSLAQDEVRKLSERVKFGINRMIKERKLIGGNLTGYYKKDGMYQINEKEAPMIRYLFETYASGKVGLKKIGEELAEMGYLNRKGEPYSQTSMAKFLTNPRYKGFYTARLTEVEDYKTHKKVNVDKSRQIIEKDERIPAIVSEELWDKANALHEKRKKLPSRHILNTEEMLEHSKYSCKIKCTHCDHIYIRNAGSNRANNPTWSCKNYKVNGVDACASPILKESYLDKIFISIFDDFINNKKDYLNQVITEYKNIVESISNNKSSKDLEKEIDLINRQKDKLLDLSLKGLISDVEFKKRNDGFNEQIFKFEEEIKRIDNKEIEIKKMNEKMNELSKALTKKVDIKNELPHLIKLLIDRIEITKVNNNRKHVRMVVYFNFNTDIIDRELDLYEKKEKPTIKVDVNSLQSDEISFNQKCSCIDQNIRSGLYENINVGIGNINDIKENDDSKCCRIHQNEPRLCRTWKKTWDRDFI